MRDAYSDLRKRHPDRRRSPHHGHEIFSGSRLCGLIPVPVAAQDPVGRARSRRKIKTCRF